MLTLNSSVDDFTRSSDEEQRASRHDRISYRLSKSIGKRMTSKRVREIGYDLTTTSDKKQKTEKEEVVCSVSTGSGLDYQLGGSSALDQDACDFLSEVPFKISKSVVSLLLFDGCINVLECLGIPIKSKTPSITRRDAGSHMKIHVRDASNNIAIGCLEQNYLCRGITLVSVKQSLNVCAINLHNKVEILPGKNLVSIQLMDSGKHTTIRGIVTKDSWTSEDGIEFSVSTCKISKAGDGGPLFYDDGNFVGMNLFLDGKRGVFMRRSVIVERLEQFETNIRILTNRMSRVKMISKPRFRYLHGSEFTNRDQEDLNCLGYPKPSATTGGMVLVNTFEEIFGDTYDSSKGAWGVLSETISKDLSQSVVSLASYLGETRIFACSGIITKWNECNTILTSASLVRNHCDGSKIQENLRIDVLLPDNRRTEGTLQHYNLHYNVAIVSFKESAFTAANIYDRRSYKYSEVVAVGRVFESGVLMATRGTLTRAPLERRFDCTNMFYSSCEITKAGIGGPLVDFDGKFVGMNFYDEKEGTPFLPQTRILAVLAHFEKGRIVAEADNNGYTNRWPVPKPLWKPISPRLTSSGWAPMAMPSPSRSSAQPLSPAIISSCAPHIAGCLVGDQTSLQQARMLQLTCSDDQ